MKQQFKFAVAAAALLAAGAARAGDDPAKPAPAAPGDAPGVAAKHENKITPEAKAAFEKMEKVSNSPVRLGLKDAAGTISMDMMGMEMSMAFTFSAPANIHVEPDPNAEGPMKMQGAQMARSFERMLRPMFGIFHPADEDEYDASLATKDGKQVLTVTNYKNGAEQGHTDFTLDENGLPASGASKTQMEMRGQKQEVSSDITFTWEKHGDLWRIAKFTSSSSGGRGGMGGTVSFTFTYTDVEKFSIATSWQMEVPGGMAFETHIKDLTVNGKKVEVTAPEGDKATPGMPGEDGDKEGK